MTSTKKVWTALQKAYLENNTGQVVGISFGHSSGDIEHMNSKIVFRDDVFFVIAHDVDAEKAMLYRVRAVLPMPAAMQDKYGDLRIVAGPKWGEVEKEFLSIKAYAKFVGNKTLEPQSKVADKEVVYVTEKTTYLYAPIHKLADIFKKYSSVNLSVEIFPDVWLPLSTSDSKEALRLMREHGSGHVKVDVEVKRTESGRGRKMTCIQLSQAELINYTTEDDFNMWNDTVAERKRAEIQEKQKIQMEAFLERQKEEMEAALADI